MPAEQTYQAFLLRLWSVTDSQWRASLEDPHTGERRAFASLEKLAEHLAQAARSGFAADAAEPSAPPGPGQGE